MPTATPARRTLRATITLVVLALLGSLVFGAPAQAQDIGSLKDRAKALADKLSKLDTEAQIADEAYLQAAAQSDQVNADLTTTKAAVQVAKARVDSAVKQASTFLVSSYMDAGSSEALAAVGTSDVNSSVNQHVLLDSLRGDRQQLADELAASRADLDDRSAELAEKQVELAKVQADRKAARQRVEASVAESQRLYDDANGKLQAALAAEQQRREEAAARAAAAEAAARAAASARTAQAQQSAAVRAAATTSTAPSTSAANPGTPPGERNVPSTSSRPQAPSPGAPALAPAPPPPPAALPPTSGGAAGAIAAARSQMGTPYRWGGASPGGFDCSGLMMWSWARVGVGLPHSSGGQYAATQRVPLSQVQPGDLIFYGSPVHHVGMYVGGGMIIDALHTGDVVRIRPMGYPGRIAGAGRVR